MESDFWTISIATFKLLTYVFSFLSIGEAMFMHLFAKSSPSIIRYSNKITILAGLLAMASSIGFLLAQTGLLADECMMGMFDTDMLEVIIATNIGTSFIMRIVGLGFLIFIVKYFTAYRQLKIIPMLLIAFSFAFIGHATGEYDYIKMPLLILHLTVVGFWFGALIPLYHITKHADGVYILDKFGKYSSIAVPALIVAGVVLSYLILGDFALLFTSVYGLFLLGKLFVVGLLLVIALANKFILVPNLQKEKPGAIKKLRRTIRHEFLIFVVVLLLTAVLTSAITLPH